MKRATLAALFGLSALVLAAAASAQTADNSNPPATTPPATTTPAVTPPATVPVSDQANPQATTATTTADTKLAAIQARARATSEKDRKTVEAKLDVTKASVDKEASAKGDNVVAGRLATEFGVTADALTAEKTQYGTGWGDLMIAHSLLANAKSDVTLDQIFQMRKDGMGWGQIANGMDLRLGEVISAVASEGRVATGREKADGKVATIHSGSGPAAPHMASTHAHSGSGTAARVGMGAGAGGSMKGHSGK